MTLGLMTLVWQYFTGASEESEAPPTLTGRPFVSTAWDARGNTATPVSSDPESSSAKPSASAPRASIRKRINKHSAAAMREEKVEDQTPPAPPPLTAYLGSNTSSRRSANMEEAQPSAPPPLTTATSSSSRSVPINEEAQDVDALRSEGNDLFKAGRYSHARQKYTSALQLQPEHAGLLSNRAAASMMLGEWQEAYDDASGAVKLAPGNGRAHERCARCLFLLGRLDEGTRFCRKRIQALDLDECRSAEWQPFLTTEKRLSTCEALFRDVEASLLSSSHQRIGSSATSVAKVVATLEQIEDFSSSLSELE